MSCVFERLALSCATLERRSSVCKKVLSSPSVSSRALRRDSKRRAGAHLVVIGTTLLAHSVCGVLGYQMPAQQLPQIKKNWLAQPRSLARMCSSGPNENLRGGVGVDGSSALRVIRIHEGAKLPARSTTGSVGYDLCSAEDIVVEAGRSQLISTALIVAIPEGFYGRVAPRSGLAVKKSIHIGAGVIDPDYRGELRVLLHNLGEADFVVNSGDRIAQLIIEACATPPVVEVHDLEMTERGLGGFGSTGTA